MMKRVIFFLLITINTAFALDTPFNHGVNITEWFQSPGVGQIQFTKYTKQDLIDIKNMGCDVVRLPINLHDMTSGSPGYTIDPLLFTFLDQVVDWAEELDLHLILDNQSIKTDQDMPVNIETILISVWTQMADHYKNRSNYIYYEILSEPHGISNMDWNNIQKNVIDAIRTVDTTHTIIVGNSDWYGYENLDTFMSFTDDNLILTFHFYDPYLFTHQGVDTTNPSLESLAGMPFPYSSMSNMPELPYDLKNTWVQSAYNVYGSDASFMEFYLLISQITNFKAQTKAPMFCGEFGVYRENVNDAHRNMWYFMVRMFFDYYGISWATMDYKGGFSFFEKDTYELIDFDLNVTLAKLLGLKVPTQWGFQLWPDTSGFDIYDDYVGQYIIESSNLTAEQLNYYSHNSPAYDDFCIQFADANQYDKISLKFKPIKDLSVLAAGNYVVDFYVRSNDPGAEFDLRFVDTKTNSSYDHPWRKRYKIDNTVALWNGTWNHISVPLSSFVEQGTYDNGQWYNPVGDFDWQAVEFFEIVSEYGDLTGTEIYFDNIRIASPTP